jgi:hypothetical protein
VGVEVSRFVVCAFVVVGAVVPEGAAVPVVSEDDADAVLKGESGDGCHQPGCAGWVDPVGCVSQPSGEPLPDRHALFLSLSSSTTANKSPMRMPLVMPGR